MSVVRPRDAEDLQEIIASGASSGQRLSLRGGASKCPIGAPESDAVRIVELGAIAGIVDYDPTELVLTVRAGTPLSEVQELVAAHDQMLAFDPFDHGPLFGKPSGLSTIGGVVAASVSGSRRVSAGAVRDHLLGFSAVSGRGEKFIAGAKVVKNVTGYDLPKLMCGSWGRLAAITELSLKVLPRPRVTTTIAFRAGSVDRVLAVMATALRSRASVAAAAHLPTGVRHGDALTFLRIEGFAASVAARIEILRSLTPELRVGDVLGDVESAAIWQEMADLTSLDHTLPLWRISSPPGACESIVASLTRSNTKYVLDWGGSLIWLSSDIHPDLVRQVVASADGHAMLVRADAPMRRAVPCLHPQPRPLAALETRVRRAFDPAGVFETGRFMDRADAN